MKKQGTRNNQQTNKSKTLTNQKEHERSIHEKQTRTNKKKQTKTTTQIINIQKRGGNKQTNRQQREQQITINSNKQAHQTNIATQ